MHQIPTLLTTDQVARRIGKSVTTVNRMARIGRLPAAYKVEGKTGANLYDPADVLEYLQRANELAK